MLRIPFRQIEDSDREETSGDGQEKGTIPPQQCIGPFKPCRPAKIDYFEGLEENHFRDGIGDPRTSRRLCRKIKYDTKLTGSNMRRHSSNQISFQNINLPIIFCALIVSATNNRLNKDANLK